MTTLSFELGPIRPPSEAYSLLIRATRNCPWNRCRFCHTYKGEKFELRTVEEIKADIETARAIQQKIKELAFRTGHADRVRDMAALVLQSPPNFAFQNVALWMYAGGESCFLQDANTLIMRSHELAEVILFLKETLPSINRVTSYGRANTAARKKLEELTELRQAGLSRLHIGLESGYDPLLKYMGKGVTAAKHIEGGRKIVESGISLCEYVILGLGGREMWRQHALETARVLNEIDPGYIRVRTLTINNRMPLHDEVENGNFIRAVDEKILEEERLLIENLNCHSNFVSDHITNLLQEVEGKLPEDKEKMLAAIDRFLSLPSEEKTNFRVGRRTCRYVELDDLYNPLRRQGVEQIVERLRDGEGQIDDNKIYAMMEGFI